MSNYTAAEVEALTRFLKAPLVAHQIEFSAGCVAPLFDGTLDQAMERNIAIAAWSPMARGGLGEDGPVELHPVRETLAAIAARYGATTTAVAIAFLQMHPAGVTPILGSTRPDRLAEALAASRLHAHPARMVRHRRGGARRADALGNYRRKIQNSTDSTTLTMMQVTMGK